jgi:hypothetical protein
MAIALASSASSQSAFPLPRAQKTASAQSLPAAQPTQPPATPTLAAAPEPAPAVHRANIDFAKGVLTVTAENSSLDQILRDIAYLTGMKITGGVADERVYGTYGPDSAQSVISSLLDGTGTNILLLENPQHGVQELILTPRTGGPTPPNLNASTSYEREHEDRPPMPGGRRAQEFGERRSRPDPDGPRPSIQPNSPEQPEIPPANETAPSANTTTEQSPNGVKTPQQIYQQLLKQQQQQSAQPQP